MEIDWNTALSAALGGATVLGSIFGAWVKSQKEIAKISAMLELLISRQELMQSQIDNLQDRLNRH